MKSSGASTEPTVHPGSSLLTPPIFRLVTIAERSGSFDVSVGYSDAKEDDDEEYLEEKAAMPDPSDAEAPAEGFNGYARNAGVQFENGGRDAKDHVEHFLDTCDDRGLEERLCYVRVKGIHDLEDMVNDILRQRELIAVIDMTENVVATTHARGEGSNSDFSPDGEYGHVVATNDSERRAAAEGTFARSDHRQVMDTSTKTEATDETFDSGNTVHDAGKCDALNELTNLLRSKVDKKDLTPELQSLLTEPATDADYMFAFAGEVNWPEDREITSVTAMETEKERGVYLSECGVKEWSNDELSGRKTEANVSVISANYTKRLRLREVPDHDRSLEVRGINPGVLETRRRALVKIPLMWERVYEFDMWIMNHSAGVNVALGTDFMIPAGRLDLFHGTAGLPDEVMVPLIKSLGATDDEPYGIQVVGGPTEDLYIPGHEWREFRLKCKRPSRDTHEGWIRRTERLVPMVTRFRRGHPTWIRLTNVTPRVANCSKHDAVVLWVPIGELPREPGYVRLRSNKYKEWQILAYAESRDETLFERERELYERWLAEQPPAVERREYPTPRNILARDAEDSGSSEEVQVYCAEESEHTLVSGSGDRVFEQARKQSSTHATDDALCTEASNGVTSENIGASGQDVDQLDDRAAYTQCPTEGPERILNATYVSSMHEIAAGVVSGRDAGENDVSEHLANDIELTDYAQELAFLPDLTEISVTALDYTGPKVQNKDLDEGQQQKLVGVLKRHEKIMISSGNALPPPAYGMVCDIDVQGLAPIKQRARRTPLRFLGKLYELLKGLLRAGLITFSDSPWASPIVIVLKKNGVDIRLCIDYKMVNAVTAIMEYAMPLADDLLTDMEAYLWFCSLDAASGFWAIMMTQRARKISAFVCALGHFEWLRMPFGLKNAPMIYQRMIDNALWGFVQLKGGWSQFAKAMHEAEEQTKDARAFEADRESSTVKDTVSLLVNSPTGDMFTNGESDESSLVPRRISVSFTKSIFVQSKVEFLSHEVSSEGIRADPKNIKAVTEVPFPTSKKVYGAALYQLKDADFAPGGDLTVAKRSFAAHQQKGMDAPILRYIDRDKEVHVMLFANEWALSSTLMQEHDGKLHPVRFHGRVLKDAEMNYHPAEKVILALLLLLKVCYTQLADRTIHVYTRFSTLDWVHKSKTLFGRTTQFAVMLSPWHLVVQRVKERDCLFAQLLQAGLRSFVDLDDSLAQVVPPTKGSPSIRMDPNLLYVRLPRSYQGCVLSFDGSAKTEKHGGYGSLNLAEYAGMNNGVQAALEHTTEDLVIVGDSRLAIQQSLGVIACRKESLLTQLNRHRELTAKFRSVKYLHVVRELNAAADSLASETLENKVSKVVSTETRLSELTTLNRIQDVIYEPTAKAETEDKPSVNTIRAHQQAKVNEKRVRFANETSAVDRREADSQDKASDMPTNAQNQVREEQPSAEDSPSTAPSANDIDPLTVQRERRRRIAVAQDEELRWSNRKTVLRGGDSKLGYRAARDSWKMSDRFTLSEDNVLYYLGTSRRKSDRQQEETILRLVVPSTMVQEANGQQERSVKTVLQSVRVYAKDPLQQDWDEIAEKLIFAINNSMDATRKETPFYLVHGWDAQSTLRAMTSSLKSLKRGSGKQTDALVWRREVNRQQEIALEMAKEYQATEKFRRARKHNGALSGREQAAIPSTGPTELSDEAHSVSGTADDTPVTAPRSLFEPGDRVWLYMERVKPGLTKKLAHRWHGPFRVKRKVEEFAYELELADRSGYRFYPVVHVSRLKAVNEFGSRLKSRLTPEVTEETRLDFDEELLPEDSWEPDQLAGEYEVEAILDDRVPLSTSTERAPREFKVKWLGYDEPT
ncbi:Hypothetical protein PHPALM_9140 [Phytophthora palmivora]|uniref:Chromo domain-containing protein n=1 Tax=Phytophthora palmivora TaxID=4796 RepID=A0A2P4Y824_9STRA|nr:Hypothetical protein PHPALM_9140 [Phytophthora palmivora]